MSARRLVRDVATVLGMTLVLGVVAGLLLLDRWWPVRDVVGAPPIAVEVPAGHTQLVCAGPPAVAPEDSGFTFDPDFDPGAGESATVIEGFVVGRPGQAAPVGAYVPLSNAGSQEATLAFAPSGMSSARVMASGVAGPAVLRASPVDGVAALVAGATLARADVGDLRGLAAARCLEPAASGWLVAGSTEVGSSSRVVFDNPGATAATVRLEAWGAVGPVELGQGAVVLVPARSERALLLEAVAPDQPRLAVRLTVEGGQVAAFVQSSALEGFVPAGIDLSGPAAEPALTVLIPGVVLDETDIDTAAPSILRVVNPGAEPASVELRLLHADGEMTVPGAERRVVEPGTVSDISLAGVPAGAYAAELVSDQPITAAAVLSRVGGPSADDPDRQVVDRAWVSAAEPLPAALVPLPSVGDRVGSASVVLTNPGTTALDVQVRAIEGGGGVGAPRVVTIPARATALVDGDALTGAVGVELIAQAESGGQEPSAFVAAAILVSEVADGQLIAAVAAQPDLEAARVVAVRFPNP